MKTKNGHILTFSEKMQISAILCFATCDWFCPMTSQLALRADNTKQIYAHFFLFVYFYKDILESFDARTQKARKSVTPLLHATNSGLVIECQPGRAA